MPPDAGVRDAVRHRAQGRCEYCMLFEGVHARPFHVDHVIAQQHGGRDELSNLAWACERCNAIKGPNLTTVDADNGGLVRLFDPRSQSWDAHFESHAGHIVGLTPEGRATVRLLCMNAPKRVQLRLVVAWERAQRRE